MRVQRKKQKEDGMPETPNLRELRERAALSQDELAERAGISRATVYGLESGDRKAWPKTIRKLAETLHVEPRDLYAESIDRPKAQAPSAETAGRRVATLSDPQPVSTQMLEEAIEHMRTLAAERAAEIARVKEAREQGTPVPPLFSDTMELQDLGLEARHEAEGIWAASVNNGDELEDTEMRLLCLQFEEQRSRLRTLSREARILEEASISDLSEEYVKAQDRAWAERPDFLEESGK